MDRSLQTASLYPGSASSEHRQWFESLAYFDPLTYEFEESEASLRVRAVATRHSELLKEWRASAGADAYGQRSQDFIRKLAQELWRAERAGEDLTTVTVEAVEAQPTAEQFGAEIVQIAHQTRSAGQVSLDPSKAPETPQTASRVVPFPIQQDTRSTRRPLPPMPA